MKSESRLPYTRANTLLLKPLLQIRALETSVKFTAPKCLLPVPPHLAGPLTSCIECALSFLFCSRRWTGSHFSVSKFKQGFCLFILASNFHSKIWDGPYNEIIILYGIWLLKKKKRNYLIFFFGHKLPIGSNLSLAVHTRGPLLYPGG